jgi:hypothetical protein
MDPIDERARWNALARWFISQDIPMGEATVCMLELMGGYIAATAKDETDLARKIAAACEALEQTSRDGFSLKTGKTKGPDG